MGLFRKKIRLELYSEADIELLEAHISQTFGEYEMVMHEIASPDIHLDIVIVPPEEGRDYITLVTMGMGAHRMNVPEELRDYRLERAELAVCLPPGWKLDSPDDRDYWPVRWLKELARLPIANDTWLGFGHSVSGDGPFAENTALSAVMLVGAYSNQPSEPLTLTNGNIVRFYQMIPLYEEELKYKMDHDAEALMALFGGDDMTPVVNIARRNYGLPAEQD
jgi:hypothetical protein